MRYVSTRGAAPILGFGEVLLAGLADDGGLYVPESWPSLAAGGSGDYLVTALEVMSPFVGGAIAPGAFADMVREAYATFESDEVTPLVDLGDGLYLLELFHGPTLAFKDIALQLVGRLFDHELSRRGSVSPSSAPRRVTRARPPSTPVATVSPWTSSSCTRPTGFRMCSAGR